MRNELTYSGTAVHPDFGPVEYAAIPLSDDPDTQVAQTIAMMRRHVIEDAESEPIRRVAAGLQAAAGLSVEPADPVADSFYWVKDRLQFQQDEDTAEPLRPLVTDPEFQAFVEMLIRPRDLVQMPDAREDCDGYATLLPTLLRAQRIPCSFVTVAADDHEPGRFSHVYAACYPGGRRIALDSSHGPYPGWDSVDTGQVTRMKEWPIDGPSWGELLLIGLALFAAAWVWRIF